MLPRYFVATTEAPAPTTLVPGHVAAIIELEDGLGVVTEWAVVRGVAGGLRLQAPASLPSALRRQVSRHELSQGRPPLRLRTDALWLCELDGVDEPRGHMADLLEPVALLATLTGPFPSEAPVVARGQLSLPRHALLRALVEGSDLAFRATPEEAPTAEGHRCISALLAADRPEVIAQGEGILLAFPQLPSPELCPTELVNELGCSDVASVLLEAARKALEKDTPKDHPLVREHPLLKQILPVVDQAAAVAELSQVGWAVEGTRLVRRGQHAATGFLSSLLRDVEARALPRQAEGWDEFRALVQAALAALPASAADDRARALATRVGGARSAPAATVPVNAATPAAPRIPRPSAPSAPPAVAAPKPPAAGGVGGPADPQDWMRDFGGGAPRAKSPKASPKPKPDKPSSPNRAGGAPPDWMKDFK